MNNERQNKTYKKRVRKALLATLLLPIAYGTGFGVFLAKLPAPFVRPPDVSGVAVFTGGSGRVETTLNMLRQGFEGPVLISGVHPNVSLKQLAGKEPLEGDEEARITLDTASETTRQNVENTLAWARERNLYKLGIVTSTYHVLRVKILFRWLAPNVQVVFMPVQPADPGLHTLWREYNKALLTPLLP